MMKTKPSRIAAVVVGMLAGACNSNRPRCADTQYFHETLRACVGRMCEPGANPMHPDCFDASTGDASNDATMAGDSALDAATDAAPDTSSDGADGDGSVTIDDSIAAPRPIGPLSTSVVSSRQPTLRWQPSASGDGAVVELSRSRDFSTPAVVLRATGDRARPTSALAAGVWFWRIRGRASARNAEGTNTSPVWLFRVGTRSADADRDTSWGNELDVNGDGFSDVAIASTGTLDGRGRVDVYYGSASGIGAMPSATLRGTEPSAAFGRAISSAGDVNGDGYGDLIVGAPQSSPSGRMGAGSVHVFLGGTSGVATTAAIVLEGESASAQFGVAVQGVGDVNADGRADIAIGAWLASPGGRREAGNVSVFAGSSTAVSSTPMRTLEGTSAGDRFGSAIAGGGDLNGDGVADLVVGAPAAEVMGRAQSGYVSVFHGSESGPASIANRTISGATAFDNFGCATSTGGDVNGDGFADVVVGVCGASPGGETSAGQALVFLGAVSGVSPTHNAALNGAQTGDAFGAQVRIGTDFNADGFSDVVVGASRAGMADRGVISVFHGGAMGAAMTSSTRIESTDVSGFLPSALACPGDFNGDGFSDLVAGNSASSSGGRSVSGAALIVHGSARGLESAPTRTLEGAAPFDAFGQDVATLVSPATNRYALNHRSANGSHSPSGSLSPCRWPSATPSAQRPCPTTR